MAGEKIDLVDQLQNTRSKYLFPNTYQQLASRTECDQTRALARISNQAFFETKDFNFRQLQAIRLNHCLIGLLGEAGEIAS